MLEKLRNQYTRPQPRLTASADGQRPSPSYSVDNDLVKWAKLVPVPALPAPRASWKARTERA